jgi:hypothetical protein
MLENIPGQQRNLFQQPCKGFGGKETTKFGRMRIEMSL